MIEQSTGLKWITIQYFGITASGKTAIWTVRNAERGHLLGEVRWFAPWRKYAFYPKTGCLFEEDCLRDIAEFVSMATQAHRLKTVGNTVDKP